MVVSIQKVMTFKFLPLQNSMNHKTPVRVIRGHVDKLSYTGKVYTFDGLYEVRLIVATSDLAEKPFCDTGMCRFPFHTSMEHSVCKGCP